MRRATGLDLRYLNALQKANRDAVGFFGTAALFKYVSRGQVWLQLENDEPCGYLLFNDTPGARIRRVRPGTATIYQVCIQTDARRLANATSLVEALATEARRHGFDWLDCCVTDTIAANDFWPSVGFAVVGRRRGGRSRGRVLNHYERELRHDPREPRLVYPDRESV